MAAKRFLIEESKCIFTLLLLDLGHNSHINAVVFCVRVFQFVFVQKRECLLFLVLFASFVYAKLNSLTMPIGFLFVLGLGNSFAVRYGGKYINDSSSFFFGWFLSLDD